MTMLVDVIARIVDPSAFDKLEDAYQKGDGWEKVVSMGPVEAARSKALKIIEAMRVWSEELFDLEIEDDGDLYGEHD